MPSLHEMQTQFTKAIFGNAPADDLIISDWLKQAQRLAIYGNHYRITLREALTTTFPTVARLVGEAFFGGMADAFTAKHAPSHPCLAEYGGDFPAFIGAFEPARSLPYLPDVALFEWLMNEAGHAPAYEDRAFYSPYPVGRIWETNQPGYQGDDSVSLKEGGGWLIVEKAENFVRWRVLNLPPDAFNEQGEPQA